VEICAGDFYRPYMDTAVLGPLGLDRTTFDTDTVVSDGQYVSGVSTRWEGAMGVDTVLDAESYSASHLWPAMGAWSSVRDIARLAEFWMSGDPAVLPDALHAELGTKQVEREEGYPDAGYGYGLNIKTGIELGGAHYPVRMVSHGGTIFGYTAHVYTVPELGVGVVALLNRELVTPGETLVAGLDLAARVGATESEVGAPDPATFAELAGTYTHDIVMGDFVFTVEDDSLMVNIPSLDATGVSYERRLTAVRPDNFELRIDGSVQLLSFLRDADGAPEFVRNRYYVGERVDGAVAPRTRPVPEAWLTGDWVLPDFGG
jgi:CubicO group peptidase (beta-lactamase class C family)